MKRAPRAVHPGAWWLWAIGLSAAAARTTNPLLLLLILVVVWHVVTARRSDAPWAGAFALFLRLGLVVITIRVIAQVTFGAAGSGALLIQLPEVTLPSWAAGITLGGAVTVDRVTSAVTDGLRLATMLACIGAANALANAKRLLGSLPAALYEIGVAVVVALSFAPSMVRATQRIRAARRLRGRPSNGLRGVASVAMPVLEDAFERSLALAAAMDARGYGRRVERSPAAHRVTATLTSTGLAGIVIGVYALLNGGGAPMIGATAFGGGILLAVGGLALSGRRAVRTRYRPDPWEGAEWVVSAAGLTALTGVIVSGMTDPGALWPAAASPASWSLPLPATAGILLAMVPAWATPPPTSGIRTARRSLEGEQPHTSPPTGRAPSPGTATFTGPSSATASRPTRTLHDDTKAGA